MRSGRELSRVYIIFSLQTAAYLWRIGFGLPERLEKCPGHVEGATDVHLVDPQHLFEARSENGIYRMVLASRIRRVSMRHGSRASDQLGVKIHTLFEIPALLISTSMPFPSSASEITERADSVVCAGWLCEYGISAASRAGAQRTYGLGVGHVERQDGGELVLGDNLLQFGSLWGHSRRISHIN